MSKAKTIAKSTTVTTQHYQGSRTVTIEDMAKELALGATDLYAQITERADYQNLADKNMTGALKVQALREAAEYLLKMAAQEEREHGIIVK